jgi:hypothetical protein
MNLSKQTDLYIESVFLRNYNGKAQKRKEIFFDRKGESYAEKA